MCQECIGGYNKIIDKANKEIKAYLKEGKEKEINYDFYTELAKHLYKRNWDSGKRKRSQPQKKRKYRLAKNEFEKSLYYEGAVELKNVSDREEAMEMINWVIKELSSIKNRKKSQNDDLKEAKETLSGWGG